MLMQRSILIEAGGKKAAQLRPIPSHRGIGVQGQAEDFEVHLITFHFLFFDLGLNQTYIAM